jgi:hypothetical protein
VWLVIADWSRREEDLDVTERQTESAWIAETLRERGESVDAVAAAEILALHREYLRTTAPTEEPAYDPIDELEDAETLPTDDAGGAAEADGAAGADGALQLDDAARSSAEPDPTDTMTAAAATGDFVAAEPAGSAYRPAGTASVGGSSTASSPGPSVRPSVRSAPLSPRGQSPSNLESDPPAS